MNMNPDTSTTELPDAAPFRVLVVEDDRSQAVFAEAILRGAGMQAEVVGVPERMMEALERFEPDLVLMDQHLPGASGTELTQRIREHPQFQSTPVVFLTGDHDPERQLEALETGGDDFIVKPVRPRHLVVAVQSRIRRARQLAASRPAVVDTGRHPVTGLYTRPALMKAILAALQSKEVGGALLLEIDSPALLRKRFGYAAFDALINDVGRLLSTHAGDGVTARLSDAAFLTLAHPLDETRLGEYARTLRDAVEHHSFDVADETVRLRCAVGYTTLQQGFQDAGAVLSATEDAAREANATPVGIAAYVPADIAAAGELTRHLRESLADTQGGALYLAYQPIVAVVGGDEAQFQALLRMHAAGTSVRKAGEIVPMAQAAGVLPQLDRWVLEHALELLQRRRAEYQPVRLFVSQAPQTMSQDSYASWLAETLESAGVDGQSLVIDMRMEDALVHLTSLQQFCQDLVPSGVQFCLSQYRHSENAERLLEELPLGYLRLSADFARPSLSQDLHDEMRVAIEKAHRLGLQVIGQAVEDPQAAAALWAGGIDYIQGNLVHRPDQALDYDFRSATL